MKEEKKKKIKSKISCRVAIDTAGVAEIFAEEEVASVDQ